MASHPMMQDIEPVNTHGDMELRSEGSPSPESFSEAEKLVMGKEVQTVGSF